MVASKIRLPRFKSWVLACWLCDSKKSLTFIVSTQFLICKAEKTIIGFKIKKNNILQYKAWLAECSVSRSFLAPFPHQYKLVRLLLSPMQTFSTEIPFICILFFFLNSRLLIVCPSRCHHLTLSKGTQTSAPRINTSLSLPLPFCYNHH